MKKSLLFVTALCSVFAFIGSDDGFNIVSESFVGVQQSPWDGSYPPEWDDYYTCLRRNARFCEIAAGPRGSDAWVECVEERNSRCVSPF